MFTYTIHFTEPCGLEGCTMFQALCLGTALGWFEREYPACLVQFVSFTLSRPL